MDNNVCSRGGEKLSDVADAVNLYLEFMWGQRVKLSLYGRCNGFIAKFRVDEQEFCLTIV